MRATVITVSENIQRMGDTRRRPSARATTCHGLPGAAGRVLSTPRACPTESPAPFAFFRFHSAQHRSHRSPSSSDRASPLPFELATAKTRWPSCSSLCRDPLYHLHRSIESIEPWLTSSEMALHADNHHRGLPVLSLSRARS